MSVKLPTWETSFVILKDVHHHRQVLFHPVINIIFLYSCFGYIFLLQTGNKSKLWIESCSHDVQLHAALLEPKSVPSWSS